MAKLREEIDENGYVVVPGVVSKANVEAVVADIFEHTGADPNDSETWYAPGRIGSAGMVEMYHYQSMWDNRQASDLHAVFADIFDSDELWVSLDRTNLKPPSVPEHPDYYHKGFMHWDGDIGSYPNVKFGVQGVLALADTTANMGGFQCVPEIFRDLHGYIERYGRDRKTDMTDFKPTFVPLDAGDMVIWSSMMAHGNGDNLTDRPRLAQYISMGPAGGDGEARQNRIRTWRENCPPMGAAFPGDPRGIEEARSEPAKLTDLGRKLLGVDLW